MKKSYLFCGMIFVTLLYTPLKGAYFNGKYGLNKVSNEITVFPVVSNKRAFEKKKQKKKLAGSNAYIIKKYSFLVKNITLDDILYSCKKKKKKIMGQQQWEKIMQQKKREMQKKQIGFLVGQYYQKSAVLRGRINEIDKSINTISLMSLPYNCTNLILKLQCEKKQRTEQFSALKKTYFYDPRIPKTPQEVRRYMLEPTIKKTSDEMIALYAICKKSMKDPLQFLNQLSKK